MKTHLLRGDGKTLCGKILAWNITKTEIREASDCKVCCEVYDYNMGIKKDYTCGGDFMANKKQRDIIQNKRDLKLLNKHLKNRNKELVKIANDSIRQLEISVEMIGKVSLKKITKEKIMNSLAMMASHLKSKLEDFE